jgi:hypothetical protein
MITLVLAGCPTGGDKDLAGKYPLSGASIVGHDGGTGGVSVATKQASIFFNGPNYQGTYSTKAAASSSWSTQSVKGEYTFVSGTLTFTTGTLSVVSGGFSTISSSTPDADGYYTFDNIGPLAGLKLK